MGNKKKTTTFNEMFAEIKQQTDIENEQIPEDVTVIKTEDKDSLHLSIQFKHKQLPKNKKPAPKNWF